MPHIWEPLGQVQPFAPLLDRNRVGIAVEVVGQLDLQEIVDEGAHARAARTDFGGAQLGLGLRFK